MAIEIVDWDNYFENNRTRELKHMAWVPVPNKLDGTGYTFLIDHPNGPAHFGAWVLLLEVASRCDVRGTLSRNGAESMDEATLARITRVPESVWREALPRLQSIGWIKGYEIPQEGAEIPHPTAEDRPLNGTELNRTERKGKKITATAVVGQDLELYHRIEKAFLSKNDNKFSNYGKEGKAIQSIIKKAKSRVEGDPAEFIHGMIEALWKLKSSGDKFYSSQPFLPSTLNSSGIWDRVLETMRNKNKLADPVAMAIARGEKL